MTTDQPLGIRLPSRVSANPTPPTGRHDATIARVAITERDGGLSLVVEYALDTEPDWHPEDRLDIVAPRGSSRADFVVDGRRRLLRIAEATGLPLVAGSDAEGVAAALIGRRLVVELYAKNGEAAVREIHRAGTPHNASR